MAKIAVIIGPGFDHPEFDALYEALKANGHRLTLIGPGGHPRVEGVAVQASVAEVLPAYFDAVVIPGGEAPGKLAARGDVREFLSDAARSGLLLAAIGHGPKLLIGAGCADGKTITGDPSLHDEAIRAGVAWFSRDALVEDGHVVTARGPEATAAFGRAILRHLPVPAG